ncbi:MAG TPA: endonuclease III [Flavobacteriales bacterium]|jgi:endonuclease-3|nr:endonuclease III [Flavobacteriales bacterium]
MTKSEKVEFIIKKLEELYPEVPIPLHHEDPFTLLIAVLLSAQCKDDRVNQITPALFKRASNARAMASMELREIQNFIRSCGLYQTKAKNIKALSQKIVSEHGGMVPNTFEQLEALPGVGHKTASVVMSQAFGEPSFPVDTHIHRTMWRWGLSSGTTVEQTEEDAKRLFPQELWNKLHLQIIYYAREYAPARGYSIEKDVITQMVGRKSFIKNML